MNVSTKNILLLNVVDTKHANFRYFAKKAELINKIVLLNIVSRYFVLTMLPIYIYLT